MTASLSKLLKNSRAPLSSISTHSLIFWEAKPLHCRDIVPSESYVSWCTASYPLWGIPRASSLSVGQKSALSLPSSTIMHKSSGRQTTLNVVPVMRDLRSNNFILVWLLYLSTFFIKILARNPSQRFDVFNTDCKLLLWQFQMVTVSIAVSYAARSAASNDFDAKRNRRSTPPDGSDRIARLLVAKKKMLYT